MSQGPEMTYRGAAGIPRQPADQMSPLPSVPPSGEGTEMGNQALVPMPQAARGAAHTAVVSTVNPLEHDPSRYSQRELDWLTDPNRRRTAPVVAPTPQTIRPPRLTAAESGWVTAANKRRANPEAAQRLLTIEELATTAGSIRARAEVIAQTDPDRARVRAALQERGATGVAYLREIVDRADVVQALRDELIQKFIPQLPEAEQQQATAAIDINSLGANLLPLLHTLRHRATHRNDGFLPIRKKRLTPDRLALLEQVAALEAYAREEGAPASIAHKNPAYAAARGVIDQAFFRLGRRP